MSLQVEPYRTRNEINFDKTWIERIILNLVGRVWLGRHIQRCSSLVHRGSNTAMMAPNRVVITCRKADAFDIRILWDSETALLTGVFAVAGGLVGGYAGGRMGAALGAGIGGAAGLGVSTVVSLREIWDSVKEKLKELFFIVFNYLRRLDPVDYARAFDILMACTASRRELVFTILDFIAHKLGREVFSSITHGSA